MPRTLVTLGLLLLVAACENASAPNLDVPPPSLAVTGGGGYTAIDLGTLGGTYSWAYATNCLGQIVGVSTTEAGNLRAFLWQNGVMTNLGTLDGGGSSEALDINEVGQVVGWSSLGVALGTRAFLWSNGVMTDLGSLGEIRTLAHGINGVGQVVGESGGQAFMWENGLMTALGNLERGFTAAYGINDGGQVVGASGSRAFLWEDGRMTDLGHLGGGSSVASDINNAGQIVGYSGATSGFSHGFMWSAGVMADLGTLGGNYSVAYAINDGGQVVGYGDVSSGAEHAFLWSGGVMTDLGHLGGGSSWAHGINGEGQVVGASSTSTGDFHATLWRVLTPVERIAQLSSAVELLVANVTLNQGEGHSLMTKLNIATAMLNDGKETPAINQLEAFIAQVEALTNSGRLTAGEGQDLIDAARATIGAIQG